MVNRDQIVGVIYSAIDEVNSLRPDNARLEKSEETLLAGEGGLDSMGVINLIVALDSALTSRLGQSSGITDQTELLMENGAFETVESLAAQLESILCDH